jgi:hypothetical protein
MKDRLAKLKEMDRGSIGVPRFAHDLYGDLRDRHLLPLVAVLIVAIAAVPFLLKAGNPDLSPTQAEAALPAAVPESARLSVVADVPTLRDYRERLQALTAKDPFRQHFAAPQVEAAQLGGGTTTTIPTFDSTSPTSTPTTPSADLPPVLDTYTPPPAPPSPAPTPPPPVYDSPSSDVPTSGGSSPGGAGNPPPPTRVRVETKLVTYRISARLGKPGEVRTRRNIDELTMLPNEEHPLAVFLGMSANGRKALLLVSEEVNSVFGDNQCDFLRSQECQLLKVERGMPVVFRYGPEDKSYQFTLTRIDRVERTPGSGSREGSGSVGARKTLG